MKFNIGVVNQFSLILLKNGNTNKRGKCNMLLILSIKNVFLRYECIIFSMYNTPSDIRGNMDTFFAQNIRHNMQILKL